LRTSSHLLDATNIQQPLVFFLFVIELDDGKIYRKPLFDGKNPWVSGFDFPLNQPNEFDKKEIGEKIQRFSPTGPETCRGYPGISRDGEVDPPPLHFEPKRRSTGGCLPWKMAHL